MVSETVYWTHVARLPEHPTIVKKHSSGSEIGHGQRKIKFASSTTFLIPVMWQWVLYPFYPKGANQPSFGFAEPRGRLDWARTSKPEVLSVPCSDPLNIACLGDHLFRLSKGRYDWATKIYFVVGIEAVGKWFVEHGSQEAFSQLVDR